MTLFCYQLFRMVSILYVREKWELTDIGRGDEPAGSLGSEGGDRQGWREARAQGSFWISVTKT